MSEQVGLSVTFDGNTAGLEAAAKRANASLNSFKRSTGDATQSLMNLSRVAQDAPYGFMGIANNLNPLLESFQRLKVETGGTKAAFSAMTAGLMGPAGMGVALGVVSSLLVSFAGDMFGSKNATEEEKEALDRFAESLKKSREELDQMAEAIKRLQEIGEIGLKLQGLPEVLGKSARVLDFDTMLLEARNGYDELIKKQDKFRKSIEGMEMLKFDLGKMPGVEAYAKMPAWLKGMAGAGSIDPDQVIRQMTGGLEKLEPEIKKAYDKITELEHQRKVAGLQVQLQIKEDNAKATADLLANLDKQSKAWQQYIEELKKAKDFLASFGRALVSGANADFSQVPSLNRPDITDNFMAGEREGLDRGIKDEGLGVLPSKEALDKMVANQKKAADDAAKVWEDFNRNIANVLANVRAELLVGLGEGLGEALGGNGIDSLATSMLNTVGSALTELGKQLIITSTAIKAFKEATKAAFAGNPVLGIAVGVGLTAIGSAMKARANKVKTFAQGGIVSTPTLGVFGEYAGAKNNPEVVAPLNKLKGMLGGAGNGDYLPMHRISGNELLLWYERSRGKQRRAY